MPNDLEVDHFTEKNVQLVLKLAEDSPDWVSVMRTKMKKSEKEYYAFITRSSYRVRIYCFPNHLDWKIRYWN